MSYPIPLPIRLLTSSTTPSFFVYVYVSVLSGPINERERKIKKKDIVGRTIRED